jgi:hypothetical protein
MHLKHRAAKAGFRLLKTHTVNSSRKSTCRRRSRRFTIRRLVHLILNRNIASLHFNMLSLRRSITSRSHSITNLHLSTTSLRLKLIHMV